MLRRLLFRLALATMAVWLAPASQAAIDFNVAPTSLSLSSNAGVPVPSQSLSISNTSSKQITVSLAAGSNFGLAVSPGQLTIPPNSSRSATASVSGLFEANGNYSGSINIQDASGSAPPVSVTLQVIGVNITVSGGSSPSIQQGKTASMSFVIGGGSSPITVSASGQGLSGGAANAPGSFTETINTAGLSPNNYSGTLNFSCSSNSPCLPQVVTVSFIVTAPPIAIGVSPPSVTVNVIAGQQTSTPAIGIGGGPTSVSVSASGQGLNGGSASAPGSFSAGVDATNLRPGSYSATLTFNCIPTACTTTPSVTVTINVTPASSITVSPPSVTVNVVAGQQTSTPAISIGGGPTSVSVSASGQGLSGGSASAPGSFSASVDATGLSTGAHSGTLTFNCSPTACTTSPSVTVTINVQAAPVIQLNSSRNSLTFQAYQGRSAPSAQALALTATGGTATYSVQNVPPWLQVSPASGTVATAPTAITITLVPSALTLGSNTATLNFAGGSSPVSVNVSANLLKLSLSVTPLQASAQLGPGQTQKIPLTVGTADGGPIAVTTTTTGGPWIKLATTDFTAPGPAPAVTLDATGLNIGSYSGSITYSCAQSSQVDCGQTAVPVSLTVTAATGPAISPGGLIVAGSFGGLTTAGPGTYVEIYGQNLATTTLGWGQFFVNNVAPTLLQGVGVKINGEAAFVDYVSPGQINALLPGDVSAGPAQVTVTNSLGTSAPFTLNIAAQQPTLLAPGAFQVAGKQYVAAFLPDSANALPTGAVAGVMSRPAKPGETLVLYGLGFGAVTPDVPVGTIAPGQLTNLKAALQVLFNQTAGTIAYSGLAPGFVGLYQFNVQVPQVADNDAVPMTFTLGGVPGTQKLYVAVHQ
jgi:uncharacterized protein (TIGR03437 family)